MYKTYIYFDDLKKVGVFFCKTKTSKVVFFFQFTVCTFRFPSILKSILLSFKARSALIFKYVFKNFYIVCHSLFSVSFFCNCILKKIVLCFKFRNRVDNKNIDIDKFVIITILSWG